MTKFEKKKIIFIPNSLEKRKSGLLEGFSKEFQDCEAFFITNNKVTKDTSRCIGYISKKDAKDLKSLNGGQWVHINPLNCSVTLPNAHHDKILKVYYELDVFGRIHRIQPNTMDLGVYFQELISYFRNKRVISHTNGTKSLKELIALFIIKFLDVVLNIINYKKIIKYSSTINYFGESCMLGKWLLLSLIRRENGPKIINLLVSIAFDLMLGLYIIKYFIDYEKDVLFFIEDIGEVAIVTLKQLLNYLMGSPIGLKLNHAFNHALGLFFFYNINLWKLFIQGLYPMLLNYLQYLIKSGVFGFSFQLALISDILSLTTFHVYCIYVYAAKLFQLQVKSIISLWRLFIGRKYNPLRERVDSCHYTQHQLFIGTLGFTILLFLLPTTTLYYVVFTTLRLVFMIVNGILYRLRYLLRCLPIYVTLLWILNSSTLAGNLELEFRQFENDDNLSVNVKMKSLPFRTSLGIFKPDVIEPIDGLKWGAVVHKLFTGILI
ncbi:phosphatidylinositol N-acetylglucosaminyltransferase subunit Q [Coccinella septempunctata]|uniref:phosphatidylinositol N-acetylglucosaminyltransferase subunit Q n=1 Tax=Coccinella septempunctata TaxID=41139 RepID=UPI001D08E151|nr:phosphatidylinositol N-acetylglucosaminyltransferase subunit Q [Coccinella septempunctata]